MDEQMYYRNKLDQSVRDNDVNGVVAALTEAIRAPVQLPEDYVDSLRKWIDAKAAAVKSPLLHSPGFGDANLSPGYQPVQAMGMAGYGHFMQPVGVQTAQPWGVPMQGVFGGNHAGAGFPQVPVGGTTFLGNVPGAPMPFMAPSLVPKWEVPGAIAPFFSSAQATVQGGTAPAGTSAGQVKKAEEEEREAFTPTEEFHEETKPDFDFDLGPPQASTGSRPPRVRPDGAKRFPESPPLGRHPSSPKRPRMDQGKESQVAPTFLKELQDFLRDKEPMAYRDIAKGLPQTSSEAVRAAVHQNRELFEVAGEFVTLRPPSAFSTSVRKDLVRIFASAHFHRARVLPAEVGELIKQAVSLCAKANPQEVFKVMLAVQQKTERRPDKQPTREGFPANMLLVLACIIDQTVLVERLRGRAGSEEGQLRGPVESFEEFIGSKLGLLIFDRWVLGVIPGSQFLANLVLMWERCNWFKPSFLQQCKKPLGLLIAYASPWSGVEDDPDKSQCSGWYQLVQRPSSYKDKASISPITPRPAPAEEREPVAPPPAPPPPVPPPSSDISAVSSAHEPSAHHAQTSAAPTEGEGDLKGSALYTAVYDQATASALPPLEEELYDPEQHVETSAVPTEGEGNFRGSAFYTSMYDQGVEKSAPPPSAPPFQPPESPGLPLPVVEMETLPYATLARVEEEDDEGLIEESAAPEEESAKAPEAADEAATQAY